MRTLENDRKELKRRYRDDEFMRQDSGNKANKRRKLDISCELLKGNPPPQKTREIQFKDINI